MAFPAWVPARGCTGEASTGSKALMAWAMAEGLTDTNMGIYNCRAVRGDHDLSMHAEGRAGDHGVKTIAKGNRLIQRLRPHAVQLGIQCMIFNRRIWSAKSPGKTGRAYTGAAPHRDHAHIELTWAAAKRLTIATIKAVLGGKARIPAQRSKARHPAGSRTLRQGMRGADVRSLQRRLQRWNAPNLEPDGIFGPHTARVVRRFKVTHGLPDDAVMGMNAWVALRKALA